MGSHLGAHLFNNLINMKKVILFMLLIFFTSSCSNEQIVKKENNIKSKNIIIENYYQPHYELIEKNYKDNPIGMKNLKTTNSMLTNIFHDIK